MTAYFRAAVRADRDHPTEGLIHALASVEVEGDRLSEDEVIANTIVTMVGGQETTTNLIGNGVLTLLRNPDQLEKLSATRHPTSSLAVEELLRYESPSQHTTADWPEDMQLGGKLVRKREAVIASMGAANRDPERFPDPDTVDITRSDNRHVAFGWASHFCFGAPLRANRRPDRLRGSVAPLPGPSASRGAPGLAAESRPRA
jgi:cytochrome P450